jgi:hypothetical protein
MNRLIWGEIGTVIVMLFVAFCFLDLIIAIAEVKYALESLVFLFIAEVYIVHKFDEWKEKEESHDQEAR